MDHRRYWFIEQLVKVVLAGNNGLSTNLDITGFLGFTSLVGILDDDDFLGSPSSLPPHHLPHELLVEDDFLV